MQYEISGSVLAGQITTTTWAGAPSRTWAWSRAIGGAGRGIGGAGQFASWTRAAQLRTSTRAEAVVLYACEAGSSECATYRTGGISEVEVTRQTFVPKYANELLSPGR